MKLISIIAFVLVVYSTTAQNYTHHQLNINYGRGLLMGHLARINHLPQQSSDLLDISYTKYSPNLAGFGVGLNYIQSGNEKHIGSIKGIYGFTNLILRKKDSTLRFKIGFGLGHVEKIYDPNENNKNIAIGSHFNANVIFKIEKNFTLNNHAFYLGGGLTHFSNGAAQTPNLGLNFVSLNAGYSLYSEKKTPSNYIPTNNEYKRKFKFGIAYNVGFKENFEPFRKKYGLHNFSIYTTYAKNEKRNYLGGIDLFYNPSVSFYGADISNLQTGLFIGKEWIINQLILGIDLGAYVFDEYKDDGFAYQRLVISYYLTPAMKATILLKSHWTVAQAFQIGIAYEIKKD